MHSSSSRFPLPLMLLVCLTLLSATPAQAQEPQDTTTITDRSEQQIESLLEFDERETDDSETLDLVEWLSDHPLDLNTATAAQLSIIPQLTPAEVSAITNYRALVRRFQSVEQLGAIPGNGDEILTKVRPFVVVNKSAERKRTPSYDRTAIALRSRAVRDLQPRKGFRDNSFAGSPLKSYNRLTLSQGQHLQAGALFEKDAGERAADGFVSGYLALNDWSFIAQAVLGDYVIEAGQGLVLWRSSAPGKGSEAIAVTKRHGGAIQPYRSTDEFHFLRGAAVTSQLAIGEQTIAATAFYSQRALHASGTDSSVSSFYEEGLFRTDHERARKGSLQEKLFGGRLHVRSGNDWAVGGSFYRSTFDKPIIAERLFEFGGRSASAAGLDAEVNFGGGAGSQSHITLFGELARADGMAGIAGTILSFGRRTTMAMLFRSYSPRFVSLHAYGFGEGTRTKNERGFYLGAEAELTRGLRIAGYLDHYTFPWRTFSNPLPATGRDYLLQILASPTRSLDLVLRYSNKTQEATEAATDSLLRSIRPMVDRQQHKLRLTAILQVSRNLRLKGRVEATAVEYAPLEKNERGFLFYHDLRYAPSRSLTLEARVIFFHTDSYDSRVYEYENDLRGVFANPALYGKGWRWYLLMRWSVADFISLAAKYAETRKDGVSSLGSGPTEIAGDLDNRLALQLEIVL